jgi:hypothetical protein
VFVKGEFNMTRGTISGNAAKDRGGGVYVAATAGDDRGKFTMFDGSIAGNIARSAIGRGGGVYVVGEFIMEGGSISGSAIYPEKGGLPGFDGEPHGAGVYVESENSRFIKGRNAEIIGATTSDNKKWAESSFQSYFKWEMQNDINLPHSIEGGVKAAFGNEYVFPGGPKFGYAVYWNNSNGEEFRNTTLLKGVELSTENPGNWEDPVP